MVVAESSGPNAVVSPETESDMYPEGRPARCRGSVEAVLFDLGGVLADFGGIESMRRLAGIENDDELWRRWLTCRWVRRFERGECAPVEFAAGVVEDWSLSVSPDVFLRDFTGWLRAGPRPGAEELVQQAKVRVLVGCLSNTNAVHWEAGLASWPLFELFDHRFLSFELGLLKPDAEVFEHVLQRLALDAHRVLFLDDNVLNVEAAEKVGLRAIRVQTVAQARESLVAARVIERR